MKSLEKLMVRLKIRVILLVGLLIGIALIFIAAFSFKGAPLVICLVVGALLVLGSWAKVALYDYGKQVIKLHEAEKLTEENRKLRETEAILSQQLEQAREKKLQVLNIQPILKLGLLEADCQIARCFDLYIDKNGQIITDESSNEPSGIINAFLSGLLGERRTRFIGTLNINFKARYGVDLKNLRIKRDNNSKTVYVEGANITYQGTSGDFPRTSWEGCVVLRELSSGGWIADDEALKLESPCKDICRDYVEESLKNGPEELEWLKGPLQDTVKHLLLMMIVPSDYSLKFVDKIEGQSVPFFEYTADLGLDTPQLE